MSEETIQHLNTQTLIGFTEKRGTAWHYRADLQGVESNHYEGPVPIEAVERRLFSWTADERPLFVALPTDDIDVATHMLDDDEGNAIAAEMIELTDRKCIVRSDTHDVLGVHKSGYTVHQFSDWLIDTVGVLVEGDLGIASAGVLRKGALAWVQIEVPENIDTKVGFTFRPYLCAASSHDGSMASTYNRGATAVVCDNTLQMNLASASATIKVRHTRNSGLHLATARDALSLIDQTGKDIAATVEALAGWTISTRAFDLFLDAVCPVDESATTTRSATIAEAKREQLAGLYANDERVAPWAGTALGVLQATNTYAHHIQTVRGAPRAERNALNAVLGVTGKADIKTLQTLATFAKPPKELVLS